MEPLLAPPLPLPVSAPGNNPFIERSYDHENV